MMGILEILIGPITGILERVIPDKSERERMAHEIATLAATQAHTELMGQIEINKMEAQHASIFVAGGRPFIIWVCGFAVAWQFVLFPIGQWLAFLYSVDLTEMPRMDSQELTTLLFTLLGMGGYRTFEKARGVARNSLREPKPTGE